MQPQRRESIIMYCLRMEAVRKVSPSGDNFALLSERRSDCP